jgi:riboflavin synthase
MFTGIVTSGEVAGIRHQKGLVDIEIRAPGIAGELAPGHSVSVNGVCLTARRTRRRRFGVRLTNETVARSTLARLTKKSTVNLELPVRVGDRLGGHIVQGHVDGRAQLTRVEPDGESQRMWFSASDDLMRYLVPKGSVALDGISLTVVETDPGEGGRGGFQVMVIPHTLQTTTLGAASAGDEVNVEVDLVAKYAERFMEGHPIAG